MENQFSNDVKLELFEKLINQSTEAYVILEPSGRVIYYNDGAKKYFSYNFRSLIETRENLNLYDHLKPIYMKNQKQFSHRDRIHELFIEDHSDKKITNFVAFENSIDQKIFGSFWMTYQRFSRVSDWIVMTLRLEQYTSLYDTRALINDEFHSIFEKIHIPQVLLNEDMKIIEINPAFKETFGVRDNVIGLGFGDAIKCVNSLYEACGNENQCRFCELRRTVQDRLMRKETIHDFVTNLKVVPNNDVWLNINLIPLDINSRKSFLFSAENITKVIEADDRIVQARNQSLKLLDEMPLLVFNMTKDRVCDFLNQTFMNYIPIRKLNFLNSLKPYMSLNGFEKLTQGIDQCYKNKEAVSFEVELKNHFGDYRMMQCQLKPIYDRGREFRGLIGMFVDVEERHLLELDLKRAKDESETANKMKSEFLANMSHEIRTPLNGIVGMIDLTLLDNVSEDHEDNLRTAKECANTLLEIINDILDFSKMEAGKLKLVSQHFDLPELIRDTIKAHKIHANTKGVILDQRMINVFEPKLMGDSTRIKQVLNNLVVNAIKFTHGGTVTIEVSEKKALSSEELLLTVKVIDTGIGISEEKKSMLFQRFSQIDGTFTREYGGTGLGLVISKQIITMMKGEIDFTSQEGLGSTFYFTIPLKISDSDSTSENVRDSMIKETGEGKKLLVVEDDKINQMVIGKILENMNLNFDLVENGLEAVNICQEKDFDIILMDIQMPVLDGVQATKKIRDSSRFNKETPIIALTAYALQGDEALFRKSGMDDYLPKPLDLKALSQILTKHLGANRKPSLPYRQASNVHLDLDRRIEVDVALNTIAKQLNHIEGLFDSNQFDLLETLVNQVKKTFDEIDAEELRTLSFKIELDLRKQNFDQAHAKLMSLREMFTVLMESEQKE